MASDRTSCFVSGYAVVSSHGGYDLVLSGEGEGLEYDGDNGFLLTGGLGTFRFPMTVLITVHCTLQ